MGDSSLSLLEPQAASARTITSARAPAISLCLKFISYFSCSDMLARFAGNRSARKLLTYEKEKVLNNFLLFFPALTPVPSLWAEFGKRVGVRGYVQLRACPHGYKSAWYSGSCGPAPPARSARPLRFGSISVAAVCRVCGREYMSGSSPALSSVSFTMWCTARAGHALPTV